MTRTGDVKDVLAAQGSAAVLSTPDEFRRLVMSEIKGWWLTVKLSGAKTD